MRLFIAYFVRPVLCCSILAASSIVPALAKPLCEEDFESHAEGTSTFESVVMAEGKATLQVAKSKEGGQALEVKSSELDAWKLEFRFPRQREIFAISWRMKLENIREPALGELIFFLTGSSTGPYFRIRQNVFSGTDAGISALTEGNTPVPMMKALTEGNWYLVRLEVNIPEQKWIYSITREGASKPAAEGETGFLSHVTSLSVLRISPLTSERGAGCDLWIDDLKVE